MSDHGSTLMKYLPAIAMAAAIVASATTAQVQIKANAEAIKSTNATLQTRLPTFLYDRDMARVNAELQDISEGVDDNEELVEQLERATDQIDGRIELEIERLRNLISQSDKEQKAQLELILQLLQQQLREGTLP